MHIYIPYIFMFTIYKIYQLKSYHVTVYCACVSIFPLVTGIIVEFNFPQSGIDVENRLIAHKGRGGGTKATVTF